MYSLCLTLGHNSSAVLIQNGKILIGYENERLSGIKSDSQFPVHAINEINAYFNLDEVTEIYVSHWSTFGMTEEMSYKHWREDLVNKLCPNAEIIKSIDHHDAHVEALRVFTSPKEFEWEIVADGFGNFNEVLSIYHKKELMHRCFGFEKSLGLLYQYTTSYLGLTMNKDEYKLLGYESQIQNICNPVDIDGIQRCVDTYVKKFTNYILKPQMRPEYDVVAGLEALPNVRMKIRDYNDLVLYTKLGYKKNSLPDKHKKIIISFFVQSVVERVITNIVMYFGMKSVALTGGLFMNVKINNAVSKITDSMSVMPICGDQSCGIGTYNHYRKDLEWPEHLFWGYRSLNNFPIDIPKTFVTCSLKSGLSQLITQLRNDKIVNFVYKDMEFGARALGHTSTFMRPTKKNVMYNNMLNDRPTIMPCAGMVSKLYLNHNYIGHKGIYKSLEYMIITVDSKFAAHSGNEGAHHIHPVLNLWTNRVQVIKDTDPLVTILDEFGVLINTSFNYHGQVIPLSVDNIVETIKFQNERDKDDRVITIIVK